AYWNTHLSFSDPLGELRTDLLKILLHEEALEGSIDPLEEALEGSIDPLVLNGANCEV
ncbi:hypothetical protein L917_00929, partial [Phytophthora nicotianae]